MPLTRFLKAAVAAILLSGTPLLSYAEAQRVKALLRLLS